MYPGRPVRQRYAGVTFIPHSGTMNLATDEFRIGEGGAQAWGVGGRVDISVAVERQCRNLDC
jgi:hypothetical protein